MRWLDITDSMDMILGKLWEIARTGRPGVLQSMGSQRVGHNWRLNNSNNNQRTSEASLVAQMVKNLPAVAPHSSTLPGKSHGWRSLVGCSPWGSEESDTTERLPFLFSLSSIGEGNGIPLQCSCLENPRDCGAWWAAIYGVSQSRTRLKQLSSSSLIPPGNHNSPAMANIAAPPCILHKILIL